MKVSIVIPTWNGEDTVAECLRGVFEQDVGFETEVLVIDSSSTDRTREIVSRFPVRLHVIDQREFDHGDTRNLGALMTTGDFIVFLVQDAYPERRDWLSTLLANFRDPSVGAAFCRIVPRPTAGMLVRRGVQGDLCFDTVRQERRIEDAQQYLAMDPLTRRIFVNFNDVCSCLRRSAWQRLPFARVMFGEDLLWAKGALEAGYTVVYEPAAPVVHSHEYDPKTLMKRTQIDAWLNRAYLDRKCMNRRRDVWIMTWRTMNEDRRFLREHGIPRYKRAKLALLSFWYHFLEFEGFRRGARTPDRLRAPQAVSHLRMKILFVVHGFPPETMAGTEVLTLSLAKALVRRGHDVVVLHRVGDPSQENYSVVEGEYDGLRVLKLANHLQFANIRETYAHPRIEERFREVLARERPDVVHFEHMIHLSATLPSICSELGIGSVVTLNDFWFRCPKVQLIRPNRTLCEGKPPILGCAACVADKPGFVGLARALSRPIRGALTALAKRYLALVRKAPKWFTKHASDVACITLRPTTTIQNLLRADFVIAPSPFLKQKMVEAGVPKERLILSDYGMETGWLSSVVRTPAPGKLRFGFIGSLVWYKGLEVLAQAFQRIDDPRAELHIHGDTQGMPEFVETRARIEKAVTRGGLVFHGRYDPKTLGRVLGAIDVLVVPSIWFENSPLAIHEAFQAQVPVLVSDLGGMRDLVRDGVGGLRFKAGDPDDLARTMRRFLDDAALAKRLSAAAPHVKTVDDNAAEMELKYRQAMGLHMAHSTLACFDAQAFQRARGAVDKQGSEYVLLRPGAQGAAIEFEWTTDDRIAGELRVESHRFAGETDVVQGGVVRVNGRVVLEIEPAGGSPHASTTAHAAWVEMKKGVNRITLENRIRGIGGGIHHLRLRRWSLHRTGAAIVRRPE